MNMSRLKANSFAILLARLSVAAVSLIAQTLGAQVIEGTGTGFFISKDCRIVTAYHVVKGLTNITIIDQYNEAFAAELVSADTRNDLALLKIDRNGCRPLSVESSDTLRKGAAVHTLGFPRPTRQGRESKFTTGIVSSLTGIADDPTTIQISTAVQPGNSGGPLLNDKGHVVGVIVAKLRKSETEASTPESVNYAIKSSILLELLRSAKHLGLGAFSIAPPSSKPIALTDIAETAEASVVLIVATSDESAAKSPLAPADSPQSPPPRPNTRTVDGVNWQSPIKAVIAVPFSSSSKGLGFAATPGQPIRASASGTVSYAGSGLKGYGNIVVIRHDAVYMTVYALNRRIFVREGETVAQGQVIAEVGDIPTAGGANFLFELRRGGAPVEVKS